MAGAFWNRLLIAPGPKLSAVDANQNRLKKEKREEECPISPSSSIVCLRNTETAVHDTRTADATFSPVADSFRLDVFIRITWIHITTNVLFLLIDRIRIA
ncbi:hypothetical protein EYF80_005420 [Liparis tanakae]|uniref:Uncharacterized protein n=1 Tax=Liparis tanakae TaxID=230148 RepID=A0A4Z2J338_9TELE|nr:hypothetical protein EYF80_005420 [Liparis tanakae]